MKKIYQFHKIKYSKERVIIHYDEDLGSGTNELTLNSFQAPAPSFKKAFEFLEKWVNEICELNLKGEDITSLIEVIGVSFSWTNEIMGAVISAKKHLAETPAPLILNTPHKPSEPYGENADEMNIMSSDLVADLEILQKEAEDYLNGKRAQTKIDFTDPK